MAIKDEHKQGKLRKFFIERKTTTILIGCAFVTIIITYILYTYTQTILTQRLQEKLISISQTTASQFNSRDIQAIQSVASENDTHSNDLKRLVSKLYELRKANTNIRFAYIMRRTNDPNEFAFIADADMLSDEKILDQNGNGEIDDEEAPPEPGELYDVSEYPVLKNEAFYHPSVDKQLQPDKWGLMMSSYAPISDANGNAVAIVGVDVLVDDFNQKTRATLLPFLLFIFFLLTLLTLLTIILARIWNERVEAVKELDRQKDELLSIVSHQLATPVSAVKWNLEMMLDGDMGKLTKEEEDSLKSLQGVTANLADLVSMILDVSRIQLGRVKIEKQELDLSVFFKEILDVIEVKAKEKKVQFNVSMPKNLPKAMLDKRYTHMTIENLLSNAIKYTPTNGVVNFKVEIDNKIMYCEVKDNGMGIPKNEQEKIFGKMYRATNARNSVDGNGFGLYVAKGAVEAQGGKIWFESEEGNGTTFMVNLPLIEEAPKQKN